MKEWEDELFEGATLEKNATFTLALDKARQKLEKFQLPDPTFYILQIIQAIIASGAERVRIIHTRHELQNRSELEVYFDGPGYTAYELGHLNDSLFESGRSREKDRTREMALGIVSCLALQPQLVRLRSQNSTWQRKGRQEDVVESVADGWSLFQVVRSGPAPEKDLLRLHCTSCRVDMTLNEHIISSSEGELQACPWPNFSFRQGEFWGTFGIGYGQLETSMLTLQRYGVGFTRRMESRIYPPIVVICEHPDLRKNASQSDIVEDFNYLQFLTELSLIQRDFSLRLATERIPSYQRELVQKYLLAYLEQYIPSNLTSLDVDSLEPDLQKMLKLPLFGGTTGKRYGLDEILKSYRQDGSLLLSERMRPRVTLQDVVVLTPTEWERKLLVRVFENVANVDERYDEMLAQIRGRRGLRSVELPQMLAEIQVRGWQGIDLRIAIPDAPLDSEMYFYYAGEDGLYQRTSIRPPGESVVPGPRLSAIVYCSERLAEEKPILAAIGELAALVEERLEEIYGRLWERLRQANRKPKFAGKIGRATDHFANSLNHWLSRDPENTPQLAVPADFWSARFLEDRQGRLVSLYDVHTWLEVYPALALVLGGPLFADDFGLKSSPEIYLLLSSAFGSAKIVQATLELPCLHEREQQGPLAGCADGPKLVVFHEETEEEEMARLKEEYESAGGSAPAEAPALALNTPAPETPVEPPELAAPVVAAPSLTADEHHEPLDEFGTIKEQFRQVKKLVSVDVRKLAMVGELALCFDYHVSTSGDGVPPSQVSLLHQGKVFSTHSFGTLPVAGWLALAEPSMPLPEELDGALIDLYTEAAMGLKQRSVEANLTSLLRKQIVALMIERPEFASVRGPLTETPLLTLRTGELCSVGDLRRSATRFGFLGYCYPGDALPKGEASVLLLTPPLTLDLLEKLFNVPLNHVMREESEDVQERLLDRIRKCLSELAQIPETHLDAAMTMGVSWGEPTRWFGSRKKYFVEHQSNGLTELNPSHSLVRSILKSREGPDRMAPVLASSVYTAINRALHEVEDIHELAFLEALLDRV